MIWGVDIPAEAIFLFAAEPLRCTVHGGDVGDATLRRDLSLQ